MTLDSSAVFLPPTLLKRAACNLFVPGVSPIWIPTTTSIANPVPDDEDKNDKKSFNCAARRPTHLSQCPAADGSTRPPK